MKKLFLALVLVMNVAFSQYYFKQSQIYTDSVIIKSRFTAVTPVVAYAAGDVVRDSVAAHNMFPVTVVPPGKTSSFYASGYILSASLTVDTANTTNANFSVLVFSDSTGYFAAMGATVDTNNALFQMKHAIQYNYIDKISFSLSTYGTTSGGATMASAKVDGLNIPFNFGTTGATKVWCILICDGAYTPKKGGTYEIRFKSIVY
jgi:hypothetical protein